MALTAIGLVSADPAALAAFYRDALGFTILDPAPTDTLAADKTADSVIHLSYGDSRIELLGFAHPGRRMPPGAANDAIFQHFAIVVNDIGAACERLNAAGGFVEISTDGPVKLPASSGSVIAFKFRDPEGHPLEFLQFPHGAPERIDHSAIVVRNTAASIAFYAELGLTPQGNSLNAGPEQAALDGLTDPMVNVTRLNNPQGALALELLCYHQPAGAPGIPEKREADAWATRLIFSGFSEFTLKRDPDGHDLCLRP